MNMIILIHDEKIIYSMFLTHPCRCKIKKKKLSTVALSLHYTKEAPSLEGNLLAQRAAKQGRELWMETLGDRTHFRGTLLLFRERRLNSGTK
jgi:hypothetical protein